MTVTPHLSLESTS